MGTFPTVLVFMKRWPPRRALESICISSQIDAAVARVSSLGHDGASIFPHGCGHTWETCSFTTRSRDGARQSGVASGPVERQPTPWQISDSPTRISFSWSFYAETSFGADDSPPRWPSFRSDAQPLFFRAGFFDGRRGLLSAGATG